MPACVCARACVRACVCARVRACVRACELSAPSPLQKEFVTEDKRPVLKRSSRGERPTLLGSGAGAHSKMGPGRVTKRPGDCSSPYCMAQQWSPHMR
jgi:hypothetical protein